MLVAECLYFDLYCGVNLYYVDAICTECDVGLQESACIVEYNVTLYVRLFCDFPSEHKFQISPKINWLIFLGPILPLELGLSVCLSVCLSEVFIENLH